MRELILNFHGVGEPPSGTEDADRTYWCDEAPFLSTLDAVVASKQTSKIPIKITFDDGNISDVTFALPALKARGLKASFFVCAGRVGLNGYLCADAIKELLKAGMSIGSHGMHHRDWRQLGSTELYQEVVEAKLILEGVCGCEITEVAIPFGSYDRRILTELRVAGYRRVYNSNGGLARRDSWLKTRNTLDRFRSGRYVIENTISGDTAAARLRKFLIGSYKRLR
jgi:peptidoglycan/xylan/chitin deacetylase (PgdA/CDA1 family)